MLKIVLITRINISEIKWTRSDIVMFVIVAAQGHSSMIINPFDNALFINNIVIDNLAVFIKVKVLFHVEYC